MTVESSSPSPAEPADDPADDYLERRTLRRGSAGWLLLTGLGVAYVVSGDYSGWNFGLAEGGFGGLAIAMVLMGVMYACMVFSLAELSSVLPTAGGGYGFARRALGPWGGFLTGTAILIEYVLAPAAISIFIGDYVESLGLFGLTSGWPVYLACFVLFIGIHLWGVGEALRFSFVVTGIAVAALLVFAVGAFLEFDASKLNDIPVEADAFGANSWLPMGLLGIWAAFPFGMWFFLGVEGVPLAAEETKDPARTLPRAIRWSMAILVVLALLTFFASAGARGANALQEAGNPLVEALQPDGERRRSAASSTTRGWPAWWPPSSRSSTRARASSSRSPAPGTSPASSPSPAAARPPNLVCSCPARSASGSPRRPGTGRAC